MLGMYISYINVNQSGTFFFRAILDQDYGLGSPNNNICIVYITSYMLTSLSTLKWSYQNIKQMLSLDT